MIAVVTGHSSPAPAGIAPAIRLTSDQLTLYHLSAAAASQPQSQRGRYAVMSAEGTDVKDTSVIDSRTGNMWSYQEGSHGTPSSGREYSRRYSPTAAQFAAMPTGRAALRAALIAQWHSEVPPPPRPKRTKGPTPVPRPITVSDNDIVFQQASDMLWNPLVSPALRSALYKVLADMPGVSRSARDSIGRRAVEVSRTDNSGFPGGKSDGITFATYESPTTGAVLESTIIYPPGSDVVTPQDPHGKGTITLITAYLSTTWANTFPATPYGG